MNKAQPQRAVAELGVSQGSLGLDLGLVLPCSLHGVCAGTNTQAMGKDGFKDTNPAYGQTQCMVFQECNTVWYNCLNDENATTESTRIDQGIIQDTTRQ